MTAPPSTGTFPDVTVHDWGRTTEAAVCHHTCHSSREADSDGCTEYTALSLYLYMRFFIVSVPQRKAKPSIFLTAKVSRRWLRTRAHPTGVRGPRRPKSASHVVWTTGVRGWRSLWTALVHPRFSFTF